LYDEEILYTDRQIGRLLDALQAAGLNDSTLLVVTSDHGEGLNEHGWWMHGVSVHEGELRVPLIVKLPGQTTARVVTTPTQLADLVPTLTEWLPLGLDKTPITPATARGLSMASALRGEESAGPVRDLHFFRRYHTPFIVAPTFPVRMDGTPSLPKRIEGEELRMRREKWELRYAEEQREAARTTLDEAERTALEALGYVQ
jgi:arylsulfatase A-like enzyme